MQYLETKSNYGSIMVNINGNSKNKVNKPKSY